MPDDDDLAQDRAERREPLIRPIPRWKRLLLTASLVLTVAGLGLTLYARTLRQAEVQPNAPATAADAPAASQTRTTPRREFVANQPPGSGSPAASAQSPGSAAEPEPSLETDPSPASRLERYAPAMFRLGFSFFVGFCVGYALRFFVKIGILLLGVIFLALIGLQYSGMLHIDWMGLQGHYDSAAGWVKAHAGNVEQILTGYLPSAASAGVGLLVGFKR